jgi:hypothetical protein
MVARLSDPPPVVKPKRKRGPAAKPKQPDPMMDDVLDGIGAIADFLGWSKPKTTYRLQHKMIPGEKHGKDNWFSTKTRLRQRFTLGE